MASSSTLKRKGRQEIIDLTGSVEFEQVKHSTTPQDQLTSQLIDLTNNDNNMALFATKAAAQRVGTGLSGSLSEFCDSWNIFMLKIKAKLYI